WYCDLVGYSAKEMTQTTFQAITHPDDLKADLENMRRLVAGEIGEFSLEKRYYHKDGSILWGNLTVSPTRRLGEHPEYHIAIVENITERKRAEESLRESEERLRLLIENAPAAIAMFDGQMRYLAVSRRWLTDYGLGDRPLLGRSHYEIFPQIPDRWRVVHQRGLAGEILRAEEDRFEWAAGTVQWLRWEVRPWYKEDSAVGGIIIFTEDISERKRA